MPSRGQREMRCARRKHASPCCVRSDRYVIALAAHVHVCVDVGPCASPAWARRRLFCHITDSVCSVGSLCEAAAHVCLYKCPIWRGARARGGTRGARRPVISLPAPARRICARALRPPARLEF